MKSRKNAPIGLVLGSLIGLFCLLNGAAHGDVIIDVQDAFITAGSSGFVDVRISSNALPGTPDNIDFASYHFGITAVGAPASALQFLLPPDLTEGATESDYLFATDSAGIDYDDINSTVADYIGFDSTISFSGIDIDNTTDHLLVRLDLDHILGPGQTAAMADGEQFRITLLNTADTFIEDLNLDPVTIDASSFDPFGVGGGLITVTASSAAVPEPSSFAMLSAACAAIIFRQRRRRVSASTGGCQSSFAPRRNA